MSRVLQKMVNAYVYSFTAKVNARLGLNVYEVEDLLTFNLEKYKVFEEDDTNRMLELLFWTEEDLRADRALWRTFVDEIQNTTGGAYMFYGTHTPMLMSRVSVAEGAPRYEPGIGPEITTGTYPDPPGPPYTITTTVSPSPGYTYTEPSTQYYVGGTRRGPSSYNAKQYFDTVKADYDKEGQQEAAWIAQTLTSTIVALTAPDALYENLGAPDSITEDSIPTYDPWHIQGYSRAEHLAAAIIDSGNVLPANYTLWDSSTAYSYSMDTGDKVYLIYTLGEIVGIENATVDGASKVKLIIGDDRSSIAKPWFGASRRAADVQQLKTDIGASSFKIGFKSRMSNNNQSVPMSDMHSIEAYHNGAYAIYINSMPSGVVFNLNPLYAYLMVELPETFDPYAYNNEFPVSDNSFFKKFHYITTSSTFRKITGYEWEEVWNPETGEWEWVAVPVWSDEDFSLYMGHYLCLGSTNTPTGVFSGMHFLDTGTPSNGETYASSGKILDSIPDYWGELAPIRMDVRAGLHCADMYFLYMELYGSSISWYNMNPLYGNVLQKLFEQVNCEALWMGGNVFEAHTRLTPVVNGSFNAESLLFRFRYLDAAGNDVNVVSSGRYSVIILFNGHYYETSTYHGASSLAYPEAQPNFTILGNGVYAYGEGLYVINNTLGIYGTDSTKVDGEQYYFYTNAGRHCTGVVDISSSEFPWYSLGSSDNYFIGQNTGALADTLIESLDMALNPSPQRRIASYSGHYINRVDTWSYSNWDEDTSIYNTRVETRDYSDTGSTTTYGFPYTLVDGGTFIHDLLFCEVTTYAGYTQTWTYVDDVLTYGGSTDDPPSYSGITVSLPDGGYTEISHSDTTVYNYTYTWDTDNNRYVNNGSGSYTRGPTRIVTQGVHMMTFGKLTPPATSRVAPLTHCTYAPLYNEDRVISRAGATGLAPRLRTSICPASVFPVRYVFNASVGANAFLPVFHKSENRNNPPAPFAGAVMVSVGYTGNIRHMCDAAIVCKNHTPEIASVTETGEFVALAQGISTVTVFPSNGMLPCVVTTIIMPAFAFKFTNPTAHLTADNFIGAGIDRITVSYSTRNLIFDNQIQFDKGAYNNHAASNITITSDTSVLGSATLVIPYRERPYTLSTTWSSFASGASSQMVVTFDITKDEYEEFPFHLVVLAGNKYRQPYLKRLYPSFPVDAEAPDKVVFVIEHTQVKSTQMLLGDVCGVVVVSEAYSHVMYTMAMWNANGVSTNVSSGLTNTSYYALTQHISPYFT